MWIGRPVLWGLAVSGIFLGQQGVIVSDKFPLYQYDGEAGVTETLDILYDEFRQCMQLCGCNKISDLTPACLGIVSSSGPLAIVNPEHWTERLESILQHRTPSFKLSDLEALRAHGLITNVDVRRETNGGPVSWGGSTNSRSWSRPEFLGRVILDVVCSKGRHRIQNSGVGASSLEGDKLIKTAFLARTWVRT